MNGYNIEKFIDGGGEARFRLKAPNGETMMTSEGYSSPSNRNRGLNDFLEVFGCYIRDDLKIAHTDDGPSSVMIVEAQ